MDLSSTVVLALPLEAKRLLVSHVDHASVTSEPISQAISRHTVSLVDQKLSYKLSDLKVKLQIPVIENLSPARQNNLESSETLDLHLTFRSDIVTSISFNENARKAKIEHKVMQHTFPNVTAPSLVAALAACFFLFCHVDDMVENMTPNAGQRVLNDLSALLRSSAGQNSTSLSPSWTETKAKHDADPSTLSQERDITYSQRLWNSVYRFREHLQSLLPIDAWSGVCTDISGVFDALIDEIEFRERRSTDMSRYLSIRGSTMGLEPFFRLLRLSVGNTSQQQSSDLASLEMCLCVVAGLQNDLLGVEKDIASGDWMNYALVYASDSVGADAGQWSKAIEAGIQQGAICHDSAMILAIEYYNAILEKGSRHDISAAHAMLLFVARHYEWASRAKRYKA